MKKTKLPKLLFVGIFIVLIFPFLQKEFPVYRSKTLSGAVTKHPKSDFSWKTWWNGDFQKNKELYLKDNLGSHAELVRIHNQLDYSLFGKINANMVVEGREGYLYEDHYVESYFGNTFIGKAEIDSKIHKIKALQDTLAQLDKTLLVILAAGKGSYFPEYFPESYDGEEKKMSNYDYYAQEVAAKNINHIDFNRWFLAMKDTISYPLFPRTGIHWNSYAELLVADSLIRYMEQKHAVDLPEIISDTIVWHQPPIGRDRDIEKGMNVLMNLKTDAMPYPRLRYVTEGKTKLNGLIISDSYYWGLENKGFTRNIFEEGHFWFYNNSVHPPIDGKNKVKELDLLAEVAKRDIIILLATDATLNKFPWGFEENLYLKWFDQAKPKIEGVPETAIEAQIKKIRADEKWLNYIREKAKERGVTLEEQLRKDAAYVLKR